MQLSAAGVAVCSGCGLVPGLAGGAWHKRSLEECIEQRGVCAGRPVHCV